MKRDDADFVIVGTGAGGATAAEVLTRAGFSVLLVEEGPDLRNQRRPRDLMSAMESSVRDMGTQATSGHHPIVLLQGKLVGGSTAINSGITWRIPEDVRELWDTEFGLGQLLDPVRLHREFDRLERDLEVASASENVLGENAKRLRTGAEAVGLMGKPTRRNASACQGSAECLQGCPHLARKSMDVSYIPLAVSRGARLYANHRVDRVRIERGRAVGVQGRITERAAPDQRGKEFEFRARVAVIIAAGAIHTPMILSRSGVRDHVGHHFQAHPGVAVVARFPEPIRMAEGATQGFEVLRHEQRYKIESLALPPEMLAARLPGAGAEWETRLAHLDYYGQWVVHVQMEAEGRVRRSWLGGPQISYSPTSFDLERLREGIVTTIEMMFAAGAFEVYPGLEGLPEVVNSMDQVRKFQNRALCESDVHLVASHLFSSCRAGPPEIAALDSQLQVRGVSDLFVLDASALPTNIGVNPQHTIMALVARAANRLAAERRPQQVA